jgi:hypothetical protein
MALDSKEKRANAARVGRPYLRAKYAVGATTEACRIASSNAYGGNALSPAGPSTVPVLDEGMLKGGLMPLAGGLE